MEQQPSRMPRYDILNDGAGPYAVFYCDKCYREYRSRPDLGATITQNIGRRATGDVLRGIPLFGRSIADSVAGEDPRYSRTMTPQQIDAAWKQVAENFRECPTCKLIVCLSDWDMQAGFCREDSPRSAEIAEAQAEQAAGVVKGLASAFGFGEVLKNAAQVTKQASTAMARCPKDGTLAPAGTRFCSECGSPMVQPAADVCPSCGTPVNGAKFCPNCGTKIERQAAAPTACPGCGAKLVEGARFCPECGAKIG